MAEFSLGRFFIRPLIPIMKAPPSRYNHLPKFCFHSPGAEGFNTGVLGVAHSYQDGRILMVGTPGLTPYASFPLLTIPCSRVFTYSYPGHGVRRGSGGGQLVKETV